MFKKIVILILFLVGTTVLNANQDNINDTKTEKVDQKKGSSKNSQKKDENILDIENMVEANILLEKINKIEAGFKDNILLKRYSNYLSYSKIWADLEQLKADIESSIPDDAEFHKIEEEPVAFGLIALNTMVVVDDGEGGTEATEAALNDLSDVESIQVTDVRRLM